MTASEDHTAANRSTYDRIAGLYLENRNRQQAEGDDWFTRIADAFIAAVPTGGRVADLGCGPGRDGARFAGSGLQVVGMDLSTGMLAVAAEVLGGKLAQADLRSLPIGEGHLNGIWCAAALLHVPEEDTGRVMEEFRRALRPGGIVGLLTAIGNASFLEPVPYAPDESRWFVYRERAALERSLLDTGFTIRLAEERQASRPWLAVLAEAT